MLAAGVCGGQVLRERDPGEDVPGGEAEEQDGVLAFELHTPILPGAANPAAARKVLNQIASSTQQFYIIRTVHVRNEQEKGPPREEGARASAPPAPSTALKFIVGNEHIEVSARIEMLRFNF